MIFIVQVVQMIGYNRTMILRFALILLAVSISSFSANAQNLPSRQKAGEITAKPICGVLINRSDQSIMGTLTTAPQTLPGGDIARHRDNFKLAAGARKEFCASGPFFEGQRLELILRTLIPLFSCKTKIDKDIYLDSKTDENGLRKVSATCY